MKSNREKEKEKEGGREKKREKKDVNTIAIIVSWF